MTAQLALVGKIEFPDPPYPPEIRSRGWSFDIDPERVYQSDTWAMSPPEIRPWLLMLWLASWTRIPCGTLPDNDAVVAGLIGMPINLFRAHREVLMRGWACHADGLLYHPTVTTKVLAMIAARRGASLRARARGVRHDVMARDEGRCCYCGAEAQEIDHIVPLSRGGDSGINNLVAACKSCNSSKGARTVEEWGR